MRRRAFVAMVLATLTVCLPARAVAAGAATPDLTLVPGAEQTRDVDSGGIRVVAQPGGGVWASATLTNNSAQSLTVEIAGGDATSSWIRPSVGSLLLASHETTTVRFTIAPPRNAPNKATNARLVVTATGAPTVTASLPVVVDVIGSPAAATPASVSAAGAGTGAATPAPARSDATRTATDVALTWAIILALGVVVARTFMPAGAWLVRQLMARTGNRALDLDELNRLLVLRPVTVSMLTASQGRRSQGRTTKAEWGSVEEEDAASGVTGRRERGRRRRSGHLNLDALNRELQLASTPSHGTRTASAQSRSRP